MDNLVFHPDRPEVLAVLGWKLSTLGDPISDLANNCMAYFLPPHFNALRGTERGKAKLGHGEGSRVQKQISSCPESSEGSLQLERKGCGSRTLFLALPCLPSLKNPPSIPPGWKSAVIAVPWSPHPWFLLNLPPIWRRSAMRSLSWGYCHPAWTFAGSQVMVPERRVLPHSSQNCL